MDTIEYTKMDYLTTTVPFEEIENCATPFEREQRLAVLADHARSVGVRNFLTLHKQYVKTMKLMANRDYTGNASNFDGQDMELDTGEWVADEYGITRIGFGGAEECACPHPLMPVLRLTNIDTGVEKVRLAFKRGGIWRHMVCDKKQIASNSLIVGLADYGIAVTSENSRNMVRYLHDVENLNYNRIPEKKSVSRLGWVGEEGFSPYVEGLVFDGEESFKTFFESVQAKGSFDKWLNMVKKIRQSDNLAPKIVLAASFASALVEPCGGLPFFLHLWGGTEVGKTVGLMLAASVWANPEMGKFIHTFNSTAVAQELSAGFVNSLPLILDELQIVKDKKDFDQMIYQLAEGAGKARGQKTGGLQKTGTWSNCIITSGEQPISSSSSGGGAVNRIIEISCKEKRLFEEPTEVVKTIKQNYGHAGKLFIDVLNQPGMIQNVRDIQQNFFKYINKNATEKQALAASMILTADFLIDQYIFKDGQCISFEEIDQYLSTKDEVSVERRAYEWLQGWIVQNKSKFLTPQNAAHISECYGRIDEDSVSIIRNVFNQACSDAGYNAVSFASWMKEHGYTDVDNNDRGKRLDKKRRVNGVSCRCIVVNIPKDILEHFEPVDEQIAF